MVVVKERKMSQLREGIRARRAGRPSMRRAGLGGFGAAGLGPLDEGFEDEGERVAV